MAMKNVVTMKNIHKRYDGQQIETHALQTRKCGFAYNTYEILKV